MREGKRQTTHPKRQRRRERAAERQAVREGLTVGQQLARLNERRGESKRERARLERKWRERHFGEEVAQLGEQQRLAFEEQERLVGEGGES